MPSLHKVINRNIVWDAPGAVYGYCPKCGAPGEMREDIEGTGKDRCQRKHTYPSAQAVRSPLGVDSEPKPVVKRRVKRG